jgi:hypothetical protein
MKYRALIAVKEKIPSVESTIQYHSIRPIGLIAGKNESKFQTKYGIELPASIRIVQVEAVANLSDS